MRPEGIKQFHANAPNQLGITWLALAPPSLRQINFRDGFARSAPPTCANGRDSFAPRGRSRADLSRELNGSCSSHFNEPTDLHAFVQVDRQQRCVLGDAF